MTNESKPNKIDAYKLHTIFGNTIVQKICAILTNLGNMMMGMMKNWKYRVVKNIRQKIYAKKMEERKLDNRKMFKVVTSSPKQVNFGMKKHFVAV